MIAISLMILRGLLAISNTYASMLDKIAAEKDLTLLEDYLRRTMVNDTIGNAPAITIFAPVDSAFGNVEPKYFKPDWVLHLQGLLWLHLTTATSIPFSDLSTGMIISTISNEQLTVVSDGDEVTLIGEFGDTTIIENDLYGENGVIHKIDSVMLPRIFRKHILLAINDSGVFSTFLRLVTLAGLDEFITSQDVTLLAPWNDAFMRLPNGVLELLEDSTNVHMLRDLLLNHVVVGPEIYASPALEAQPTLVTEYGTNLVVSYIPESYEALFNDVTAIAVDGLAANGVVHALDGILIPDGFFDGEDRGGDKTIGQPTTDPTTGSENTPTYEPTVEPTNEPIYEPSATPTYKPTIAFSSVDATDLVEKDSELQGLANALRLAKFNLTGLSFEEITVFAPINSAFDAVNPKYFESGWSFHLEELLLFHTAPKRLVRSDIITGSMKIDTLSGEQLVASLGDDSVLRLDGGFGSAEVVDVDLAAGTDVVHKIDTVMLPILFRTDIVDLLLDTEMFDVFLRLTIRATLEDALREVDVTLLAPIDAAFDALPEGFLTFLENVRNFDHLVAVVLNHIITGPEIYPSFLLVDKLDLSTAQGSMIEVNHDPETNTVAFNGIASVSPNGLGNNGVAHALGSGVLIPDDVMSAYSTPTPTSEPTSTPTAAPQPPTSGEVPDATPGTSSPTFDLCGDKILPVLKFECYGKRLRNGGNGSRGSFPEGGVRLPDDN